MHYLWCMIVWPAFCKNCDQLPLALVYIYYISNFSNWHLFVPFNMHMGDVGSLLLRTRYFTPPRHLSPTRQEGRRETRASSQDQLSMSSGLWPLLKFWLCLGPLVWVEWNVKQSLMKSRMSLWSIQSHSLCTYSFQDLVSGWRGKASVINFNNKRRDFSVAPVDIKWWKILFLDNFAW